MKKQTQALLMFSSHQKHKLMQWKLRYLISQNETAPEAEPSVEREGPFYFLFADKDGEKYGRANKLSGLDKALAAGATEITKKNILPEKWHIHGLTAKCRYR